MLSKFKLPAEITDLLKNSSKVTLAHNTKELTEMSCPNTDGFHEIAYEVPGKGLVKEAYVCKVKNGISANYYEPYMRRRDPDCMLIGDDEPTDKERYKDTHKESFDGLRSETFNWLKKQDLIIFPFIAGHADHGIQSFAIVPANAGFFALGIAMLQGIIDIDKHEGVFEPKFYAFVAPPFRHTHFKGKQIVIHNRQPNCYELFSYNLYPGPSAKKGAYGALIHFGEKEGWVTNHAAVVQVLTPYDIKINIMHEGASGGGKSEMNEHMHREFDGSILFGTNTLNGFKRNLVIPRGCRLRPVTDDMSLAHKDIQKNNGKLTVIDAESAWFIRVDHIKNYGTDPDIESLSIHPKDPLLFLNLDAQPGGTALLWDHIEDTPGKACPNPRFIMPRTIVPDIINTAISIDVRSFGVRTPVCTKENPSYGIIGLFHILPPAIAWLWRLVSPRGHDNPSIISSEGMQSEGVGSYWPFATGKKITQANLLLKQIVESPRVHYALCPVKHVGVWQVGFMPQWIMREYLTRRGGISFSQDELSPARYSMLGYALNKLNIESNTFEPGLLKVELQAEVGLEAYDKGADILHNFFHKELMQFNVEGLDPLGKKIIDCFLKKGSLAEFEALIEAESCFED